MKSNYRSTKNGYTLIETLVASAVMMVAIGAASSLSLSMVSQEEMSERSVRVMNHLENAATLYQLGFSGADIDLILPDDPAVHDVTYTEETKSVTGLVGVINTMKIEIEYYPSASTDANATGTKSWTGGDNALKRTHAVEVFRSIQ